MELCDGSTGVEERAMTRGSGKMVDLVSAFQRNPKERKFPERMQMTRPIQCAVNRYALNFDLLLIMKYWCDM